MAKRTSARKKTAAKRPAAKTSRAAKKKPTKKTPKKKAAGKKKPAKKTAAKKTASRKKAAAKKAASKKSPRKKASGKKAKGSSKTSGTKKAAKKASSKKTAKSVSASKKTAKKPSKKSASGKKKSGAAKAASARVTKNGAKKETQAEARAREEASAKTLQDARDAASRLAALAGLPAVASGDAAPPEAEKKRRRLTKSPIGAKQLAVYRDLLLQKRREVVGNVSSIEGEALNPERSGSLSALPQHMADQGSDEFDQTLSLGIAASQRKLLQEIDDALERMEKGVFGICEMTGGAIQKARLEATPWCRYSYEGAQMADRGHSR